jgi:hypothetical protein
VTIKEIFGAAGLSPNGPVTWKSDVSENAPGVYLVALTDDVDLDCMQTAPEFQPIDEIRLLTDKDPEELLSRESKLLLPTEPAVYIGCTIRPISQRVNEFHRHVYGRKSPDRGGQAVKLLQSRLWLHWSPAPDPRRAEAAMLNFFCQRTGSLPFANRLTPGSASPSQGEVPNHVNFYGRQFRRSSRPNSVRSMRVWIG